MLGFASLITLGIIFGFVFVIIFLIMYFSGAVDMPTVIGLTILVNIFQWLFSPFFMDLMYRWFYRVRWLTIDELGEKSKKLAEFIKKTCEKYRMKVPKIRLIEDDNPTAFTFGSGVYNARLALSEGLFTYLDDDEIEGVIAHELGHIRRRDFIIMTIAATGVQILYELSQLIMNQGKRSSGDRDRRGNLVWAGLLAYVFYFIGTYLLLFLSRVREYGADTFSAHETENPDSLARALVKIAYGIIAKPDTAAQQRLLVSTRALGIFDNRAAKHLGVAYEASHQNWHAVSKVLAYDLISPWAKVLEWQSTHPLTGKRIARLETMAKNMGKKSTINVEEARRTPVDRDRLYRGFATGIFMHFLPWILPLVTIVLGIIYNRPQFLVFIPGALGLAYLFRIFYKYPSETPKEATTLEIMSDLYASPVRGHLYTLEGKVVGRGEAGAYLSEDIMLQDHTGLIYLNYESVFSSLGNFIFALRKVRQMIGEKVKATGWFFRDVGHHLDLKILSHGAETIRSYPRFWGVLGALLLIGISLGLNFYAPLESVPLP